MVTSTNRLLLMNVVHSNSISLLTDIIFITNRNPNVFLRKKKHSSTDFTSSTNIYSYGIRFYFRKLNHFQNTNMDKFQNFTTIVIHPFFLFFPLNHFLTLHSSPHSPIPLHTRGTQLIITIVISIYIITHFIAR